MGKSEPRRMQQHEHCQEDIRAPLMDSVKNKHKTLKDRYSKTNRMKRRYFPLWQRRRTFPYRNSTLERDFCFVFK